MFITRENLTQIALTFINILKKYTRRASAELGISRSALGRFFRPYRSQILLHLTEDNLNHRMAFAEVMLKAMRENPQFVDKIVWSNEECFKISGHVNQHGCISWYDGI